MSENYEEIRRLTIRYRRLMRALTSQKWYAAAVKQYKKWM